MALMQFTKGTRFVWKGLVYCVEEPLVDNRILLKNLSMGGTQPVAKKELLYEWAEGQLEFEVFGRHTLQSSDLPIPTRYTIVDFKSLPDKVQFIAWRRYQFIVPFVGLPSKLRNRRAIDAYLAANRPLIEARAKAFKSKDQTELQSLRTLPRPAIPPKSDRGTHLSEQGFADTEYIETPSTEQSPKVQLHKRSPMLEAASAGSVERWLDDFTKSGYDLRSLVSTWKAGKARHRSDARVRVDEIIEGVLDECRTKKGGNQGKGSEVAASGYNSVWDVFMLVVTRIAEKNRERILNGKSVLKTPSRATVERRIKAAGAAAILKRAPANKLEAHENAMVGRGPSKGVTRVMQRLEMDNTWLDLVVVDEILRLPLGRPNLAFTLDVFGMPAGFGVGYEDASASTTRQCLLHTILPKPDCKALYGTKHSWDVCGIPEMLIVDCGPDFDSLDLKVSCGEANIIYEQMPVQAAWFKGSIESYFHTISMGLLKPLPGSTFSNILERGGYDPEKHACISLTAFTQLLHIFLVDYYPSKWHEGKECYPRKSWQAAAIQYEPTFHHSADQLRTIMAHTAYRTIRADGAGIQFESLYYNSPDLIRLRTLLPNGERVRIKIDDHDMGHISVLDNTDPNRQDWVIATCSDPEYASGVSLWAHKLIRKFVMTEKAAGQEVSIQDMAAAKKLIRQVVAREFMVTKSAKSRRKALRLMEGTGGVIRPEGSTKIISSKGVGRAEWPFVDQATSTTPKQLQATQSTPVDPNLPEVTSETLAVLPQKTDDIVASESAGSGNNNRRPSSTQIPGQSVPADDASAQATSTSVRRGDYNLPRKSGLRPNGGATATKRRGVSNPGHK